MSRSWISCLIVASTLAGTGLRGAEQAALDEVEKRFGRPALWVPKPKVPPVIDGKLDDPCWKDAGAVALGYSTGAWWDVPSQTTEARVLADDRAVYFAVRCFEAEPGRV